MRTTTAFTAAALAATGVVLSAGAAGAQTTPNPDLRTFVSGPACAEGVVTGSVKAAVVASTLPKGARPQLVLQLRWNAGGTAYADASVVATHATYIQSGANDYAFSLDASAVPSTAKNLLVYATTHANPGTTASETLQSRVIAASSCTQAASATTISRASLRCSGDVATAEVAIADAPASGSLPASMVLQGRSAGSTIWTSLGTKASTVTSTTTSLSTDFSLAGKHKDEYRLRATVNNGAAVFSPVVLDTSCAPAEVVPEAPAAVLVPLTLAATAATVALARRRRPGAPVSASA